MIRKPTGSNDPRPPDAPQRVQRIIAAAGLCSRREAEKLIEQGRVTVNEEIVTLGATARPADRIHVNGVLLERPEPIYILLNKPAGFITAVKDWHKRTVMDLVPIEERVYPVGRLDKGTTGILLLTNDGDFATRVAHPRYTITKTYVATLDRALAGADKAKLIRGIPLEEGFVKPHVRVLSPRRISVSLHQGYNHIVKRLFNALGYRVTALTRTRIGPLTANIPEGAFRVLKPEEVAAVLAATSRDPAFRKRFVSKDTIEAARRERRELREKRAPKTTTWEPRRPGKGGRYREQERTPRVSREERATLRDALRDRPRGRARSATVKSKQSHRAHSHATQPSSSPSRSKPFASNRDSKRSSYSRKKRS
jgi:23S rRNA pseudouridine2605 synthase